MVPIPIDPEDVLKMRDDPSRGKDRGIHHYAVCPTCGSLTWLMSDQTLGDERRVKLSWLPDPTFANDPHCNFCKAFSVNHGSIFAAIRQIVNFQRVISGKLSDRIEELEGEDDDESATGPGYVPKPGNWPHPNGDPK